MKKFCLFLIIGFILTTHIALAESKDNSTVIDIDQHGSIMLIIDYETGEISRVNKAAIDFYGYPIEVLIGMSISDINTLSEEDVKKEMDQAKDEHRGYFEFMHKTSSGKVVDVDVYSSPIKIDGKMYLFSIVNDVSKRTLAEKKAKDIQHAIYVLMIIVFVTIIIYTLNQLKLNNNLTIEYERYDSLFSNMKEGVALHSIVCNEIGEPIDYMFLEVNTAFEEMTGLLGENILGKFVKDVMPNIEESWIKNYGEVAITGKSMSFENYSIELNKHFKVNVYAPKQGHFVTVFMDMTKEVENKRAIESDRALIKTTLYSLGDAVISTDVMGRVDLMNATAEDLSGWKVRDARGKFFYEIFELTNEFLARSDICPVMQVIKSGKTMMINSDTEFILEGAVKLPVEGSVSPIVTLDNAILGAVIVLRDYSEKKERMDKIVYLSYHDQLTGLYNRHHFDLKLRELDDPKHLPIAMMMIDVNGLKLTNDAFGHRVGDQLLIKVSDILNKVCGDVCTIARIGGDEFVVVITNTTGADTAMLSKKIYEGMSLEKLKDIIISVSIGWDIKETMGTTMADLFVNAEENMYRRKLTESQSMRNSTIKAIINTLNMSNDREKIHSERVSEIAVNIGRAMGLTLESLNELRVAGLMHDIGKIVVDNALLNKTGPLTEEEFEEVKKHPKTGYHILRSVDAYTELAEYALSHHERWDGKGYPRGLRGEEIPFMARIISVADAVEAMTADRPYRKGVSVEKAIEELERHSASQFDPAVVAVCKNVCWYKADQ